MTTTSRTTHSAGRRPARSAQRIAEEGQRAAARQLQGEGNRRQGRRDPAQGPGQQADPRPRFLSRLAGRRSATSLRQASCLRHCGRPSRRSSSRAWRSLLGFGWAAVALGPTNVLAGLSLDEATARHRALVAPPALPPPVALTPIAIEEEGGDDVTAAVGGHGDDIPPLLRPEIRGDGGLRLRTRTALADGAVRARFGVTWQPSADHSDLVRWHGDQRAARRRPPLRLGRAAPLGPVVDRQPDPRRRRRGDPGDRLAQERSEAVPDAAGSPGSGPGRSMPSRAACRRRTDRSTRTCSACACR